MTGTDLAWLATNRLRIAVEQCVDEWRWFLIGEQMNQTLYLGYSGTRHGAVAQAMAKAREVVAHREAVAS